MKILMYGIAWVVTAPLWLLECVSQCVADRDVWLVGHGQLLSLLPALPGRYIRNAYYAAVLDLCPRSVCLEFGSSFTCSHVQVGRNVHLGLHCKVGLVDIGEDTIISDDVQLLSGGHQHIEDETYHGIHAKVSNRRRISVGRNCWIGTKAVVMADIGDNCIIGAGAVVTRPIPSNSVAVGVPARVIRKLNSRSWSHNAHLDSMPALFIVEN